MTTTATLANDRHAAAGLVGDLSRGLRSLDLAVLPAVTVRPLQRLRGLLASGLREPWGRGNGP